MKFNVNTKSFLRAVTTVSKAVNAKSPVTCLAAIYIQASKERVTLISNNLEISIKTTVTAEISEWGNVLIDAKMLLDAFKKLPDKLCTFSADREKAVIVCEKAKYSIATMCEEDFPKPPEEADLPQISFDGAVLEDIIKRTSFAVSADNSRPALTGMCLKTENDNLTAVGLDGYRIAISMQPMENLSPCNIIIPGKTMNIVQSVIDTTSKVMLRYSNKYAFFHWGTNSVATRLIEAQFTDYSRILRADNKEKITVGCEELIAALEKMETVIENVGSNFIKMTVAAGNIALSCKTVKGTAEDSIRCRYDGEEMTIGFNYRYLHDALKHCDADVICLKTAGATSPVIIQDEQNDRYLFVVLPVRIQEQF